MLRLTLKTGPGLRPVSQFGDVNENCYGTCSVIKSKYLIYMLLYIDSWVNAAKSKRHVSIEMDDSESISVEDIRL